MLREYCPVIGASHAEGEASSSIAPWRLSASVQHHLIALSPLTSSDRAFSPLSTSPLTLFIYPSYMCSLFRFPTLCEEHPSPRSSTSFIFFFSSLTNPSQLISPTFSTPSRHAPTLVWELRCNACGVVALAWGGQFLGPEGCCSACLFRKKKLGVLGSAQDEQLEGWRAVGVTEVTAIENLGSRLKGAG